VAQNKGQQRNATINFILDVDDILLFIGDSSKLGTELLALWQGKKIGICLGLLN
jgi:hypothetical protein